jgi:hypothetical protein
MALMTCPDCSNQYPDDAPYCPNCGRPNPARQAGAASASAGAQPETPATGPTGSPPADGAAGGYSAGTSSPPGGGYSAGAGSTGGGGYSAGAGSSAGGGYGGGTGGGPHAETPAGGAYGGQAGGGYAGGGGYTPPAGGGGGYGGGGYGGGAPGGGSPPVAIPNYLVQAILVTLCCCLPFGIVSIVYASQVNSKRDVGDIAGAWEASKNAKKWAMIGAGVGVVWVIVILAFNGLAFFAALANGAANQ